MYAFKTSILDSEAPHGKRTPGDQGGKCENNVLMSAERMRTGLMAEDRNQWILYERI
jgi:hypothetical protein